MTFEIEELEAEDTGEMVVFSGSGKPTNWVWVFAGPGHPNTIKIGDKLAKERLARSSAQEQAQVNGKKWKPESETPSEVMSRNVETIAARLLGWHMVDDKGNKTEELPLLKKKPLPFSKESAESLLIDPKTGALLDQAIEFLASENAFMKRSVKGSSSSQSENSNSDSQTKKE